MLDAAAPGIVALAGAETLVVSIIAGKTIANLAARLPGRARVRPRHAQYAGGGRARRDRRRRQRGVTARQRALTQTLLSTIGRFDWLPDERLIDAVTALSGSGPAYVFALVEALAEAGAALGLPPDDRRCALRARRSKAPAN